MQAEFAFIPLLSPRPSLMSRDQAWTFVWDLGPSRRLANIFLLRGGLRSRERQSLRDYNQALLSALEGALSDLDLPDPAIVRVLSYYGAIDDCNWSLEEVQYVDEQRLIRTGALLEVD